MITYKNIINKCFYKIITKTKSQKLNIKRKILYFTKKK